MTTKTKLLNQCPKCGQFMREEDLTKGEFDGGTYLVCGRCNHRVAPFKKPDPGDVYRCQFCEKFSNKKNWKDNACPNCGGKYDPILAQEGDD